MFLHFPICHHTLLCGDRPRLIWGLSGRSPLQSLPLPSWLPASGFTGPHSSEPVAFERTMPSLEHFAQPVPSGNCNQPLVSVGCSVITTPQSPSHFGVHCVSNFGSGGFVSSGITSFYAYPSSFSHDRSSLKPRTSNVSIALSSASLNRLGLSCSSSIQASLRA